MQSEQVGQLIGQLWGRQSLEVAVRLAKTATEQRGVTHVVLMDYMGSQRVYHAVPDNRRNDGLFGQMRQVWPT